MKRFNRFYYPPMLFMSGLALVLAVIEQSTPTAIMGGAFLLSIEFERMTDAIKNVNPQREQEIIIHKPLFKPKEPKETEEEKRLRILSENIENYDGSARNQVKI
jgi:hypothetical protein